MLEELSRSEKENPVTDASSICDSEAKNAAPGTTTESAVGTRQPRKRKIRDDDQEEG